MKTEAEVRGRLAKAIEEREPYVPSDHRWGFDGYTPEDAYAQGLRVAEVQVLRWALDEEASDADQPPS